MLVQHLQTLFKTENRSVDSKIEHVVWSPTLNKLAVCLASSNQITLFDSQLMEKKEKFTAKSNLNSKGNDFHVKGLAFSTDGTKIAVGQTDFVIHVYKIGVNWSVSFCIRKCSSLVLKKIFQYTSDSQMNGKIAHLNSLN